MFVLATAEVQILHYYRTSIYENVLSLASLADTACALPSFVNFSPSPSCFKKSPTPEDRYLVNVTQDSSLVFEGGVRIGGVAKLGSSFTHMIQSLSQHHVLVVLGSECDTRAEENGALMTENTSFLTHGNTPD